MRSFLLSLAITVGIAGSVFGANMTGSPIVGAVTTTSAKVNVRTDAAASVVIEYDTSSSFTNPTATSAINTVSGSDFTATFSISSLTADTRYYYRVMVDTVEDDPGFTLRFDTLPSSGSFTFSVFADVASADRNAEAYVSAGGGALLAFQIGDFDHGNPSTLAECRDMHKDMRDDSLTHGNDFAKRVASKRGLVHIWDDHDYCGNDEDKNCSNRSNAWQAFKEFYPTYPLANGSDGLWRKFTVSNAEFFVLDLRSQRDDGEDTDNSNKSMLDGDLITDDQKDWLLDGLNDSTADWKFVISSVTFNVDARPNSIDLWHSFSTEAQEIDDWLTDESIVDVIVVSADLHTGGGIDDGTNSLIGVPEVTVPHTNLAGGNRNNLGTWSEGVTAGRPNGSGYVLIDVFSTSVTIEVYDEDGNLRRDFTVN